LQFCKRGRIDYTNGRKLLVYQIHVHAIKIIQTQVYTINMLQVEDAEQESCCPEKSNKADTKKEQEDKKQQTIQ
jgi:hypothetical protein